MENTASKCDVCLGGEGQASASSQLLPLISKHLGNFMRMKPVRACDACGQLLTLWDDFSRQARLNLAISRPEAVKNGEQCDKDKQVLQADNSTQELSSPCDSTFVSPTASNIPDSQCPTLPRTETCTNQDNGSILKSILQSPEPTKEENKVAYLRQIKLAPIDHHHFGMSKEYCEESKPSEVCNKDTSHSKTSETVAPTEESSFTSDFMCKQTQTATTMKILEKLKPVQPPTIPVPQSTNILMPSVDEKDATISDREENHGNTSITSGNIASADTTTMKQGALQQGQSIYAVAKRGYANTTKIKYMNLGCLPCPTCNATLPTQKALHEHMMNSCLQNRHSQFICAFCARQYNSKPGLSYHLMQHFTELSSLPCPVCNLVLSSSKSLKKHQDTLHADVLPAPDLSLCVFCKVMFCKSDLMEHYNNCRQNNLVVCLKKCNIAEQLSVFTCSYCYKIFTTKLDLLYHLENVHKVTYHSNSDAKFTCTSCSHKFKDSPHTLETVPVTEGTVNSPIISASDEICDGQISSPNDQKISSSQEIVDSQTLSSVEVATVNQVFSCSEEIGDSQMLSPVGNLSVNNQDLSSTEEIGDRQMLSSVEDVSVNNQVLYHTEEVGDNQMLSSVEVTTVNDQVLFNEEIGDRQMLSPVEVTTVNDQVLFSSEDIGDRQMLSPVENMPVNNQVLSYAEEIVDSQMLSPNEEIIDNQITSSNMTEDEQSSETHQQQIQCQICNRKFTVIPSPEEVLTSKITTNSNTLNQYSLRNSKPIEIQNTVFLQERVQTVPNSNSSNNHSLRNSETIKIPEKVSLQERVKTVPKKKLFKCDDCGKVFFWASYLQRHQNTAKHIKEVSLAQKGSEDPNSGSEKDYKIPDRVEVQQEQPILPVKTDSQTETPLATCKLCNRGFDKVSGLLRHLSYHSEEEAKALKDSLLLERELSEKSKEEKQMLDEMSVKTKADEFTCHMCFKTMESVKQLKNHIHNAHLAKNCRLKCPLCPFRFITHKSLNGHIVVHSNSSNKESIMKLATQINAAGGNNMQHSYKKSKYTCNICFKSFSDSFGFQRHKSYNHNFNRQHSSKPIRVTSVIKTFKCTLCQNKYPTARGLNQHLHRFHNSATLSEKSNEEKAEKMNEHIASNSKAASVTQSFKCTLCQNQYPTARGLNQHLRRFHNSSELVEQPEEEEKVVQKGKKSIASSGVGLPCDYCHLVFPSESTLETHFQMDHLQSGIENVVSGPIAMLESSSNKNKIEAPVEMKTKPEQTSAKQTKEFGCNICNRFFFSEGRLHIHLFNAHHKRTKNVSTAFQCKYCMKQLSNSFQLKKHMEVMHANNPRSFLKSNFNCDLCGRGVNTKMGLFRHMLHHRKWV